MYFKESGKYNFLFKNVSKIRRVGNPSFIHILNQSVNQLYLTDNYNMIVSIQAKKKEKKNQLK